MLFPGRTSNASFASINALWLEQASTFDPSIVVETNLETPNATLQTNTNIIVDRERPHSSPSTMLALFTMASIPGQLSKSA